MKLFITLFGFATLLLSFIEVSEQTKKNEVKTLSQQKNEFEIKGFEMRDQDPY